MAYQNFGSDKDAALEMMLKLGHFQLLHNELRNDFGKLYSVTGTIIINGGESQELIRACIKELFSLIEADIYHLNYINPYNGYDDRHSFIDKLKETYKHHCKTHESSELYKSFADNYFQDLRALRTKRDSITHPKNKEDVQVDNALFEKTHKTFKAYVDFVSNSMQGVGVSFQTPNIFLKRRFPF